MVIFNEMIHEHRMVPMDGRPHVSSNIRLWQGDSRGRWEGNTLVVETTNFNDKRNFQGSSQNMRLIERFTRTAPDTLVYEYTVDDPATFTKPWTARLPMARNPEPIYEYACHEGNYAMPHAPRGTSATSRRPPPRPPRRARTNFESNFGNPTADLPSRGSAVVVLAPQNRQTGTSRFETPPTIQEACRDRSPRRLAISSGKARWNGRQASCCAHRHMLNSFRRSRSARPGSASRIAMVMVLAAACAGGLFAAGIGPMRGGPLPDPLPLFPSTNWWNADVRTAPVDVSSSSYIAFVNGTRTGGAKLHPDLGGQVVPGGTAIYGMPYVVVDGSQPKVAVQFLYSDESDGVDHATNTSYPFYPIPTEAITERHWIEGGDPGNVDLRSSQDRHLLIVDRDNRHLYELYNVFFDPTKARWFAGSGAFYDMNTNDRRPDGWTSADAAGLAILPGLIRHDEVYPLDSSAEIAHALRVTVRATNGYVYPASHRAGSTLGALPMGARLRLKASKDTSAITSDAGVQRLFRAMKRYGLIVADNGSDMYITGTFDSRWDNGVLNPAFAALTASDFEVVKLGWRPSSPPVPDPPPAPPGAHGTRRGPVERRRRERRDRHDHIGRAGAFGRSGGHARQQRCGRFASPFRHRRSGDKLDDVRRSHRCGHRAQSCHNLGDLWRSNAHGSVVDRPALTDTRARFAAAQSIHCPWGAPSMATVTLTAAAPSGGAVVALASSQPSVASVPSSVTVQAGAKAATFQVTTVRSVRARR